jgi:DNA-binding NarL/FixJ family response regulator
VTVATGLSSAVAVEPLRVLVVDEELLFGRAMAYVLADDPQIAVVGVVSAREIEGSGTADVVVIDIDSEDVDDAVANVRRKSATTRICALSSHTNGERMQHCLGLGVDAYVVKDSSLQELRAAIKTLGAGDRYVDPRAAASLRPRRSTSDRDKRLSQREIEVVRLIAEGLSNREIGRRLVVAEKTIRNHVSNVFVKLRVSTRSQAAVYAIKAGLAS